ncbi:hypothetical protein ACLMPP_20635 [Yersinia enterocolitica]|uniref:hypothetical protein n=1 Tax=Yersinia enterocolitica TaxID=630 RepID=UPI00398CEE33
MHLSIIAIIAMVLNIPYAYSVQNSANNGHWQEGMFNNVIEFGGKISTPDVIWKWFPHSVSINNSSSGEFKYTNKRVVYEENEGQQYIILEGRTSDVVKHPKPGIQPVIRIAETESLHIPVKGEFENGQVCYGEMTFKVIQIPVYQDRTMSEGWIAESGLSQEEQMTINSLLAAIPGYSYTNRQDLSKNVDVSMFNYNPSDLSENNALNFAGGWLTTIKDIRVNIPNVGDKLNRWQGVIYPEVFYF